MLNIDEVIKRYKDVYGKNPSRLIMSRCLYLELSNTSPYSSWFCTTIFGDVFYKGIKCRIKE